MAEYRSIKCFHRYGSTPLGLSGSGYGMGLELGGSVHGSDGSGSEWV